jgi:hypothetical protein
MSDLNFEYSEGTPKTYTQNDFDTPQTREFYPNFGIHLLTRSPSLPEGVLIKVGTLNDPSIFIAQTSLSRQ